MFKIIIDKTRKVFTNKIPFDVTIIEIKKTDRCILFTSFLEIDEDMFKTTEYDINNKNLYMLFIIQMDKK